MRVGKKIAKLQLSNEALLLENYEFGSELSQARKDAKRHAQNATDFRAELVATKRDLAKQRHAERDLESAVEEADALAAKLNDALRSREAAEQEVKQGQSRQAALDKQVRELQTRLSAERLARSGRDSIVHREPRAASVEQQGQVPVGRGLSPSTGAQTATSQPTVAAAPALQQNAPTDFCAAPNARLSSPNLASNASNSARNGRESSPGLANEASTKPPLSLPIAASTATNAGLPSPSHASQAVSNVRLPSPSLARDGRVPSPSLVTSARVVSPSSLASPGMGRSNSLGALCLPSGAVSDAADYQGQMSGGLATCDSLGALRGTGTASHPPRPPQPQAAAPRMGWATHARSRGDATPERHGEVQYSPESNSNSIDRVIR